MKTIIILAITLLLTGCVCSQYSNIGEKSEDFWVEISFFYGSKTSAIYTKISHEVFNDLTHGKTKKGWVELNNCVWLKDGEFRTVEDGGEKWGYGNDYFIRTEHILRIIPISKEAQEKLEGLNQSLLDNA